MEYCRTQKEIHGGKEMTWRETYDTVLKYFRSKGDKEAEAKARSKPMQYYEDNFADEIIDELATK